MTVLVTGGAGYIGSHIVFALLRAGEGVVVADNLSTGMRSAVPDAAQFAMADIGDGGAIRRLLSHGDIDAIIHLAGSIVVPDSVVNPLSYYRNNTVGSCTLIEAAVRCGVRQFVFSSSAAVYGSPTREIISEDAELQPVSPYGHSKLMTEVMLRHAAAAHGLSYVILRYFNVAGAERGQPNGQSTGRATHLIRVACQTALGLRPSLEIYGTDYPTPDGTCIRDYIHVGDLADAHLLALQYLRSGGESLAINCGYGRGHSVRDVIEAVRRISGANFNVRESGRRQGDPAALIAEAQCIRDVLGWKPSRDNLARIVSDALEWEKVASLENGQRVPVARRS